MDAALRVVRYLKNQPGQGLLLSSKVDNKVTTYCDADWAACPLTRKSVTGYMIKIGDSLVSWKAKKQTTVSRSSAEAEYRSLASTISELVWLLGIPSEVNAKVELPVQNYSDSKTAIQIAANPFPLAEVGSCDGCTKISDESSKAPIFAKESEVALASLYQ
ncbi:uncharacterized mitochondrial protein AtMg00810-like [Lycium ferocissimum]|uniref:uncharacterized mitochondrial protein AtMg00810-like n=1 Tax=Lycium ferocissimum TaxID=112874 RepID=UPI0028153A10|nr:uncharacterized mitochondrial protein AtMg00810-like [Lycium ferocissimum]